MRIRRTTLASTLFLIVILSGVASAQTEPEPTLRDTLRTLTFGFAEPAGRAIELATQIEVANTPFGTSAGGFVFKVDPATGLRVRSAPTFGPSFAERVMTIGEGKVSFGASLAVATYDKLNEFELKEMPLARTISAIPEANETAFLSLVLSSETLLLSTSIGATDKLDISMSVPFVKVKLDGISWFNDFRGNTYERLAGKIESSGLGDLAVGAKYRLVQFGEGPPDPGGIAVQLVTRLPTGKPEQFRGLGITRVLGSLLYSSGKGRFRPHGNIGFEWWEEGLEVPTDAFRLSRTGARHQVLYAAGFEVEANPKITLLVDLLGRHLLGDGSVALQTIDVDFPDIPEITSLELPFATEKGIREWSLAPGLKWNLKGNLVFSGNALISLRDNGLRDFFTPVFGLDWTF